MAVRSKKTTRGLHAIARAREDRASGKARWTAQAGLVAAVVIVGGFVAHKCVSDHELVSDRQALLAKQRAVEATLGKQWFPLRDKLEADVLGAALGEYQGDLVDPEARTGAFKTQPGLYLRMRLANAKSAEEIRKVAADAKKDAFAACLLREPNERGLRGEDGGAFAEQPWNLGQAYAATRILTGDWVANVNSADDELRLRVFQEQFTHAQEHEIPLAIDVVTRAQFLLLALDEDVPEAAAYVDGGTFTEEALQLAPHPTRVHLFDLASGREILRLRRVGDATVIPAGERVVSDSETRDAEQRQANNCALARRVDEALRVAAAP